MRLTLLGATGRTGRHVLDQILTAGHEVSVLVRDPARLPQRHDPRVTVASWWCLRSVRAGQSRISPCS
ncbi:NAD(P)H-binding protein [Nonomuraea sp. NPDC050556]|uniref:NAD(P)H-binding protein n=1 Tax=Nonomuraea sp. NPDC050556 TaxID=3364369 RepID=UPI0037A783CE